MGFIKDLYYGNISPAATKFKEDSDYAKTLNKIVILRERLEKELSKEQLSEVEKLCDLQSDLLSISSEENYVKGFRDGVKMVADAFCGEDKNLINVKE